MRRPRPFGTFLFCYLPGLAGAVALGRLSAGSAPALAPLVLLSTGFLAFAVAVSVAATPPARDGRLGGPAGDGAVLALLSIRRHRWRHAAGFALAGSACGAVALRFAGADLAAEMPGGAGRLALATAVLLLAARAIIGRAACSQEAIRRALLGEVERG